MFRVLLSAGVVVDSAAYSAMAVALIFWEQVQASHMSIARSMPAETCAFALFSLAVKFSLREEEQQAVLRAINGRATKVALSARVAAAAEFVLAPVLRWQRCANSARR